MMAHVFYIFGPFLTFLESFIQTKAHNMLAIMLDLEFKNMKILCDYARNFVACETIA
jgi:hypothetical protein